MVRAGLRLDMQNSSQERRRNSAPPPPRPRGGLSALAGREEQAGQARRPCSPHTLSLRGKSSANRAIMLLVLPASWAVAPAILDDSALGLENWPACIYWSVDWNRTDPAVFEFEYEKPLAA